MAKPITGKDGGRRYRSLLRGLLCLTILPGLGGCSEGVLHPKGPIAAADMTILVNSLGIMLAIVIPTIIATLGVAWWYRASNTRARYEPDWEYSGRIEMIVWSIPTMTILLLGGIAWIGSHQLDPPKAIPSRIRPVTIEVVSLDWKWLFIYPDLGIASVNAITIPVGQPIDFRLTASGVMNSFFIPELGSQIYAMPHMITKLELEADDTGQFKGLSANFSGAGFPDMTFTVDAVPPPQFADWVKKVHSAGPTLDEKSYEALLQPSSKVPPSTFSQVTPALFDSIALPNGTQPLAPMNMTTTVGMNNVGTTERLCEIKAGTEN